MKKKGLKIAVGMMAILFAASVFQCGGAVSSAASSGISDNIILDGVYMESLDLSGMTADEAKANINKFVESLKQKVVTFGTADDGYVAVTVGDLGLRWVNEDSVETAVNIGKTGNIVKRYKAIKDLQSGKKVLDLELNIDKELLRIILEEQCAEFDIPARDASMVRVNNQFEITEGQTGERVNVEQSLNKVYDYITENWDYQDASIALELDITEPKGSNEELALIKDVLGTYTTSYTSSGKARSRNVENGCALINGRVLYPGEEFSTYDMIKPFTEANGYYPAASYSNGKVVDSLGGGICQVSTTLYNAVLLSEMEITERHNHSMIISYVDPSMDAAIAESAGKDFRFKNNLEHPVYIEGITADKHITFNIYGVETRDPQYKVRYESEILSTTRPSHENIVADASQGIGYIHVESAHIGYTAQLWKIVEENGVETHREVINKSSYKVSPRTATVGVSTDNPAYSSRMMAAVSTGSIDHCKAEAAAIKAEMNAVAQQQADLEAYYQALAQQQLLQQQQAATQQQDVQQ